MKKLRYDVRIILGSYVDVEVPDDFNEEKENWPAVEQAVIDKAYIEMDRVSDRLMCFLTENDPDNKLNVDFEDQELCYEEPEEIEED